MQLQTTIRNKTPPKQQPLLLLRQVHAWRRRLSAARVEDVVGKSQFASDTKPNVASLVFAWDLQFPCSLGAARSRPCRELLAETKQSGSDLAVAMNGEVTGEAHRQ